MSYKFTGGFNIRNQESPHFLTFTIVGWIDIFSRQICRDIIISSLNFCRTNKGLRINGYVIMSNHIHCILTAEQSNLSDIIRDFKTYTSKLIIQTIQKEKESRRAWLLHMFSYYAKGSNKNQEFKVWIDGNHPEEIISQEFFHQKLNYIHENPVRAGVVGKSVDYIYSSASNYQDGKGVIEIDFLYNLTGSLKART